MKNVVTARCAAQWVSKNTGQQPAHDHCCENLDYLQNLCAEAVTIASFLIPTEQLQNVKLLSFNCLRLRIVLIRLVLTVGMQAQIVIRHKGK